MNNRLANERRREAYEEGYIEQARFEIASDVRIEAHEIELEAIERLRKGASSMYDLVTAELLAKRCFCEGCAMAEGDISGCPGWCADAIAGFTRGVSS